MKIRPKAPCFPGILFAVLCMFGVLAPAAWAAPQIEGEPKELELGDVQEGIIAEGTYTIRNTGDEPLVIERTQTSCKCAEVKQLTKAERTIAPGATLKLPIKYDTTELFGPRKAYVVVTSNDPDQPVLLLRLNLDIKVLIRVRPRAVRWGRAIRGGPLNGTLKLTAGTASHRIELVDIRVADPSISVSTEMTTEEEQQTLVARFALAPDMPLGVVMTHIDARVRIQGKEYALQLPMSGLVLGDIICSPPLIAAMRVPVYPGARISAFTVRPSRPGGSVDVLRALTTGPIRTEIVREEDKCLVEVFASKDAPSGPQGCQVQMYTTSLDEPVISAPVFVRMAGPVALTPEYLTFNLSESESPPVKEVRLRAIQSLTMKIRNVQAESECLKVDIVTDEQADPKHPAVLAITVQGETSKEWEATGVTIETDQPGAERVRIPVLIRPPTTPDAGRLPERPVDSGAAP